ncbi:MAG: rod shape-determining protein MreD [Ruminococcaceae bacterium]|nr:rod shape-determining protein MreD [Oscillospiraceae bacterium]
MKYAVHCIFLTVFLVIQATWLDSISVFGVIPNLFIIYIAIISCFCSKKEGAIAGFFFGLMLDFQIGKVLGLNAVLLMLLGYVTALFCEKVIRKNTALIVMIIVFIISLFYELIYYVVSFMGNLEFGAVFFRTLIPECIYNCFVAAPFYFIIKKLSVKLWDESER